MNMVRGLSSQVRFNLNLVSPSADSPPAAARPPPSLKTTASVSSTASQDTGSLVNLLSKVDMSPADLLSALSKVQGLDSLDGENLLSFFLRA